MEIQKIFSDMYGEERLYSVLMTEEEVALFSEIVEEIEEEEAKKTKRPRMSKKAKIAAGVGTGAVVIPAAAYGGEVLVNKAGEKLVKSGKMKKLGEKMANAKALQNTASKAGNFITKKVLRRG